MAGSQGGHYGCLQEQHGGLVIQSNTQRRIHEKNRQDTVDRRFCGSMSTMTEDTERSEPQNTHRKNIVMNVVHYQALQCFKVMRHIIVCVFFNAVIDGGSYWS